MKADLLHVVAAVANPIRWKSRIALYNDFKAHMLASGVNLTVVECAYGDRPFELDGDPLINHVGVRSKTMVWNKENLQMLGVQRLPAGWKYVSFIDADIMFRNPGWASEAVHALQQYDVIQPWSDCYDLGPNRDHVAHWKSFVHEWWHKRPMGFGKGYRYAHTGYAWAFTRQAYEWLGGLIETAALGAGDHHMAWSLIGQADRSIPSGLTDGYTAPIYSWQSAALQHINLNIGFCQGQTIEHFWHGRKEDRNYIGRWDVITKNNFDPRTDLKKNSFGVLELAGNKPQLRIDLDHYFRQRNEDLNG